MKIIAGPALQRKIDALKAQTIDNSVQGRISQIVRRSAVAIVAGAKKRVPVSTGALRRSLQAVFVSAGQTAIIGSFLPYAAKQEFDLSLDHRVRDPKLRKRDTSAGARGTVIKGTGQSNPAAEGGFLRHAMAEETPNFIAALKDLVRHIGGAWKA